MVKQVMRKIVSVIVAAGRSRRMEASLREANLGEASPREASLGDGGMDFVLKPYMELGGKPIFLYSLEVLSGYGVVQPVIGVGDGLLYEGIWHEEKTRINPPVMGGETRAASVLAGLRAVGAEEPDIVIIHDAARPFIEEGMINRLIGVLEAGYDGVAPALPVVDALKVSEGEEVTGFNHQDLLRVQTPQIFCYETLMEAFKHATLEEKDELAVLEGASGQLDIRVKLIHGDHRNVKITYAEDLAQCAGFIEASSLSPSLSSSFGRVGIGVDVHSLTAGDHVKLGGVRISHDYGVSAWSDGDVVLHALADAIFGAVAGGDLGIHFPSDPRWKDCDSVLFLRGALDEAGKRGFMPEQTDITIICERPAIAPYREAIRRRIGELLSLPVASVSVKATTTDGAGLIGEEGAIAATAIIQLRRR